MAPTRPDLQYTTSVLMPTLETPLKLQEMQWKRLASYINPVLELRWGFQYQEMSEAHVEVDCDWAQCPRTRRSTRGGLCSGTNTCWTATVSISTRHRSALRSTARLRFIRNVLQAVELKAMVRVITHSSAAAGITQRLGAGRVRRVKSEDNRADMLTKFLDPERHH